MIRWPGRARRRAAGPAHRDAGSVTAEFAVALPAFVLVVAAALCGVMAMTDQLRCADAAAAAARLAARGEPPLTVRSAVMPAAPRNASLTVTSTTDTVVATVTVRLSAPGVLGSLPSITLSARSVAAREPGAP